MLYVQGQMYPNVYNQQPYSGQQVRVKSLKKKLKLDIDNHTSITFQFGTQQPAGWVQPPPPYGAQTQ